MQEEISSSAEQKFECVICNRKFKAITNTQEIFEDIVQTTKKLVD